MVLEGRVEGMSIHYYYIFSRVFLYNYIFSRVFLYNSFNPLRNPQQHNNISLKSCLSALSKFIHISLSDLIGYSYYPVDGQMLL